MPGGTGARAAPNEAVLQAVEAAAAQGKGVTVAQVTAATGLPTDEVEMEMAALLRACNGFFALPAPTSAQDDPSAPQEIEYRAQVLDTSHVQYIYPKGLRNHLWRRSLRLRLRSWAAAAGAAAFAVLRVSFGILLLLSLAIVVVVMLVLIARSGGAGGGAGDRHGRHGLEGAFRLMRPRRPIFDAGDLYWWLWWREWLGGNPFFYGYNHHHHERMRQQAEARRRRVLARLDEEEAGGGGGLEMVEASAGSGSGSGPTTRSTRRRTLSMSAQRRGGAGAGRYDELEDEFGEEDEEEDEDDLVVDEDVTFLEAVFSMLFGDGPPGPSENERWQRIARLIHEKQGVVVAEEVAPLLTDVQGAEADPDRSMLPVLERFGGKPIQCCLPTPTTSNGTGAAATTTQEEPKPAYIFDFARMREGPPAGTANKLAGSGLAAAAGVAPATPATPRDNPSTNSDEAVLLHHSQQHPSAHTPSTTTALALVPATEDAHAAEDTEDYWTAKAYLEEKRHRFSRAPLHHLQMAGALGLVNLVGAMWLLDQPRLFPPPAARALYVISRILAWYAWAFLLLPLLRLALIARWNRGLKRRNALRRFLLDEFKARGADAASDVHRKLEFASRYRAHVMGKKTRPAVAVAAAVVGGGAGGAF